MNKRDNCETNPQRESLADLPLTDEQADQTTGGSPGFDTTIPLWSGTVRTTKS